MKKLISLALVLCMLLCIVPAAFADNDVETKTLRFNSDGTFKIVVLNDFQDTENTSELSLKMLNKLLDQEKPDLVVLNGDQLCELYPSSSYDNYTAAIGNILKPINSRGIPFIFNYGNHDNDKAVVVPLWMQETIYHSYDYCFSPDNCYSNEAYNKLIMSNDGTKPLLNIYMINTGIWESQGILGGVTRSQVQWYKYKSDQLRAMNGDKPMPSLLFQHAPVYELHKLLTRVPENTPGAVNCQFIGHTDEWYVLDDTKVLADPYNYFMEGISSENPALSVGEYDAWLEKGDILEAVFAHDHMNNFRGETEDGIVMGYNGGFGFAPYGNGGMRVAGVFEFNANKGIENYTHRYVSYNDLFPEEQLEAVEDEGEKGLNFEVGMLIDFLTIIPRTITGFLKFFLTHLGMPFRT